MIVVVRSRLPAWLDVATEHGAIVEHPEDVSVESTAPLTETKGLTRSNAMAFL